MAFSSPLRLLALAFLSLALAAGTLAAFRDNDNVGPQTVLATPTLAPPTQPLPTPVPILPADTSLAVAGGETTLVEVGTGRAYVWLEGSDVQNARFSQDGRWLVYNAGWDPNAGLGPNTASVYRIDLQAQELAPEPLGPGFNPVISSRGNIAYVGEIDGQGANVYLRSTDGTVLRLSIRGSAYLAPVWAPDGSYLVYPGATDLPTGGVRGATPVVIAAAPDWAARVLDYGTASMHGLHIDVSPDGRYVMHGYSRIVSVVDGRAKDVRTMLEWLDGSHYHLREYSDGQPATTRHFSVDADTGKKDLLFEGFATHWNLDLGMFVVSVQEGMDPNRPGGQARQYVQIRSFDGSLVLDAVPGEPGGWSRDNRYVITTGSGSRCGIVLYDLTGKESACLDTPAISWGPPGVIAYLQVTQPAEPNLKIATADVYLRNLDTGSQRLLLTGMRWGPGGPCLRWSPDWRWLVADDYCDTF